MNKEEVQLMRYIMTLFWSVAIGGIVSYVLSSMAGDPFNLTQTFVLAGIFAIIIFLLGDVVIKEEKN